MPWFEFRALGHRNEQGNEFSVEISKKLCEWTYESGSEGLGCLHGAKQQGRAMQRAKTAALTKMM